MLLLPLRWLLRLLWLCFAAARSARTYASRGEVVLCMIVALRRLGLLL